MRKSVKSTGTGKDIKGTIDNIHVDLVLHVVVQWARFQRHMF